LDAGIDEHSSKAGVALKAAQMYYVQSLTMEAIASELRTSRSTVSRLLDYARASGIVEVRLHSPFERGSVLEESLRTRFKVKPHVVPTPDTVSDIDRLERVARSAARVLNRFFDSNTTMGVAWGSTVNAVSMHLVPKPTHNSTIVQLNGAGNTHTTGIEYASEILQRFGSAYGAAVQQFPVPAFFDSPLTKQALWRERSTQRVLEIQQTMDIALFGLGSPFAEIPSHVYIGGYLDAQDYRSLSEDRVVGDVATVFYRGDGSYRDVELNERSSGLDLARLRKVARRVCVVSGRQKLASVRGALSAGLITDLVLDEELARRLLAS
jgi:DNA-binding transcriptional regulator LsrR (DeoR family)